MSAIDVGTAITQAHHEEWAQVVAALTRRFGDLDIAEEAAAEAFATAVRRESKRDGKQKEARRLYDNDQSEVPRGVRQSHRAGGQHRRDRLPDPPPRPACVAPERLGWEQTGRHD